MAAGWPISRFLAAAVHDGDLRHFVTPSHGVSSPESVVWKQYDVPGLERLDLPYVPTEVWKESEATAASRFGTMATYYFPSGVSYAVMAALHAAFSPNTAVLLGRNVHRSVVSGITTLGARIHWLCPDGAWFTYNPESLSLYLHDHPEIAGVVLTNPSYEGDCTNMSAIAAVCRRQSVLLIVDESLGSHWAAYGSDGPSALAHADLVMHSAHKRLGALVPAGLLHVPTHSRVPIGVMDEFTCSFRSTSASNAVLLSIEAAIERLFADDTCPHLLSLSEIAMRIRGALESLQSSRAKCRVNQEPLLFHFLPDRRHPAALAEIAYALGCNYEHADERGVMYFVSPHMTGDCLQVLADVLREAVGKTEPIDCDWFEYDSPVMQLDPADAIRSESEDVVIGKAHVGRVGAGLVAPCPPGIALVVPGQRLSSWHVRRLSGRLTRLVR